MYIFGIDGLSCVHDEWHFIIYLPLILLGTADGIFSSLFIASLVFIYISMSCHIQTQQGVHQE